MDAVAEASRLAGFLALAWIATLLPQGVWATLLALNLRTGIALPWSAGAALLLMFLGWRWAGGEWPWRSQRARALRRANRTSLPVFIWALVANGFSIGALASLWLLLNPYMSAGARAAPDFSQFPPALTLAIVATAALVGAVAEEVGFRGYIQGRLETVLPWPLAIAAMALIAAPAHALTQGLVWPVVLFYALTDIGYGLTARLANSILPGLVAHAVGLGVFFLLVWPLAARARFAPSASASQFQSELVALMLFAALAIWSFIATARSAAKRRAQGAAQSATPAAADTAEP